MYISVWESDLTQVLCSTFFYLFHYSHNKATTDIMTYDMLRFTCTQRQEIGLGNVSEMTYFMSSGM